MERQEVDFKGTVVYQHNQGGYYTIVSDSGDTYYPDDLPARYRDGGLRVHVKGKVEGEADHGNGRRLIVYDIEAL